MIAPRVSCYSPAVEERERGAEKAPEEAIATAAEGSPPLADAQPVEVAPPPGLARKLVDRTRLLLPWASLAVGVVSALMLDRSPDRAWIAASAAAAVWLTLVALQWFSRATRQEVTGFRRFLLRVLRFSSLMATQSLVQLTLFFALPFYFQAAALDAGHVAFLAGLCLLSLVSLWDPWTEWILETPILSALLPATCSFVALAALLPVFGLSTRVSLWLAALLSSIGVPLLTAAAATPERRRLAAVAGGVVALALPLSLLLGASRIIPAAPLRLVKAEMGTRIENKWVVDPVEQLDRAPRRLYCATAIYSPLGLKDRLFHVWRKDGRPLATVELKIVGGRRQGYRTRSRISHFGRQPDGEYSCTVQTQTGQVLGTRSVLIGR